jgi:anionic cell wall polymer biosynthesis LytR-Cps2A-Psr (LCP) family protein
MLLNITMSLLAEYLGKTLEKHKDERSEKTGGKAVTDTQIILKINPGTKKVVPGLF